jgi:hypothetical protein
MQNKAQVRGEQAGRRVGRGAGATDALGGEGKAGMCSLRFCFASRWAVAVSSTEPPQRKLGPVGARGPAWVQTDKTPPMTLRHPGRPRNYPTANRHSDPTLVQCLRGWFWAGCAAWRKRVGARDRGLWRREPMLS